MKPNHHITTPKQAITFSLVGIVSCSGLALYSFLAWGFITWYIALICTVGLFFSIAFTWASLKLDTRNQSVKAHNLFVYFSIAVIILIALLQWGEDKVAFPTWAIIALVTGAVTAYSVMFYHAIMNFARWINGKFKLENTYTTITCDESIKNLRIQLFSDFGEDNIKPYTPDTPHSICFMLDDIPATFSVITIDGTLPLNVYSIQIENNPPGEYIYNDDEISLDDLIELIKRYTPNMDDWPLKAS